MTRQATLIGEGYIAPMPSLPVPPTTRSIAVIGLGYVGLPVAIAFARSGARVIGFDIDPVRIGELASGVDRTREIDASDLRGKHIRFSSNPRDLKTADFFIVTVPTPIDAAKRPDMSIVVAASRTVGEVLKHGDIVVYESTVYPGATQEDCIPVLEQSSGLVAGRDFAVGYSPERINPGDKSHRFETITKVVSAQNAEALELVANVYGSVVTAGVHRAPSIRVAEAAKVIENTQRDLNIALMNELALIFHRLDIDTGDVLAAAGSKWNFLRFSPGLVGGHCIGVDPYYLTHRAEQAGYTPEVILAGRRINDSMGTWIARECVKRLMSNGGGDTVTILGVTFKENVPDIRNSKVADIAAELRSFGLTVQVADPFAANEECQSEYGFPVVPLDQLKPADAVILAVPHRSYVEGGWPLLTGLLKAEARLIIDVKSVLDRASKPSIIDLWRT
jgi:UDP-N-acetyl-D-glucosamine/UDP-N-acetyl-D-galactosamine dehydrogenase